MDDGTPYEGAFEGRTRRLKRQDVVLEVRPERRRSWSPEEKRRILHEALTPGAVAADIIRRHGISSSLYYTWRRLALDAAGVSPAGFLPVQIEPTVQAPPMPMPTAMARMQTSCAGGMEIRLTCGVSVRVDRDVDGGALSIVLKAIRA